MIPATPNPGTADPNPLVGLGDYRRITKDVASTASDIEASINDALDIVQNECKRTILYAQYTERLYVYSSGMVYPSATPFDITKLPTNPSGDPPTEVGIFQGNGIWVGWYAPLPSLPLWEGVVPNQTDITYWGGYTGPLGPGPLIPAKLVRILCRVAWFINNPVVLTGMPAGVKSASVGDVSMSGDLSSMTVADPQLGRDIARWTKRQARGWSGQVTT